MKKWQRWPPPPPPRDQAPDTELADALITALDTDGDGAISNDELTTGLTSAGSSADSSEIFSALDKNEDGVVSKDELAASLTPPPQQASSEDAFSQLDTDSSTDQASVTQALEKMIANLSKQYSLDNVATVGKYLNVAT